MLGRQSIRRAHSMDFMIYRTARTIALLLGCGGCASGIDGASMNTAPSCKSAAAIADATIEAMPGAIVAGRLAGAEARAAIETINRFPPATRYEGDEVVFLVHPRKENVLAIVGWHGCAAAMIELAPEQARAILGETGA